MSLFETLLQKLDATIYVVRGTDDPLKGRVEFVSDGAFRLLGYRAEDFIRDPALWSNLMHPEDRASVIEQTREIYRLQEPRIRTYRLRQASSGEYRWIEDSTVPLLDEQGTLVGIAGVARDVTALKSVELDLQNRRRQMETLMDALPDGVLVVGPSGHILRSNAAVERILGWNSADLVGQPVEVLIPEPFRSGHMRLRSQFAEAPHIRRMGTYELVALHKDGSEVPVDIMLGPLANGEEGRVLAMIRDMTEYRNTQQALAYLSAIVTSADDSIVGVNLDGVIVTWNRGAEQMFGYTAREAIGKHLTMLLPGDRYGECANDLQNIRLRRRPPRYESQRVRKDGTRLEVAVIVSPIEDSLGRLFGMSSICRDITERKEAERQLRASETRLRVLAGISEAFWANPEKPQVALTGALERLNPDFADMCTIRFLSQDGQRLEPAVVARGPSVDLPAATFDQPITLEDHPVIRDVLQKGEACLIPAFGLDAGSSGHSSDLEVARRGTRSSIIMVPLRSRQGVVGMMSLGRLGSPYTPFTQQDVSFAQELADRVVVAFDFARLMLELQTELEQRRVLEGERVRMIRRLQALTRQLQHAREEERKRIAREIHDELGQQLTGLKMRLDYLNRPEISPAETTPQRELLYQDLETAIRTVRKIATELRPGILDSLGLVPALEWLADDFQEKFGIACRGRLEPLSVDNATATTVFRVAQEALTNVARHSGATEAVLTLSREGDVLRLEVADNGTGIREADIARPDSFGLIGMQERAALAGGSLTIGRGDSGGARLVLTLPLPRGNGDANGALLAGR
jgi:PAS domain S-box-containing protein